MNDSVASHKFSDRSGYLLITLAMLIFGGYALFLRFFPGISALAFLFAFQLVGAVCFGISLLVSGPRRVPSREELRLFVFLAFAALANDLAYFLAFRFTSVANAAVGHQTVSVFLLLFAPYFLGEKSRKGEYLALFISLAGVAVLFSEGMALRSLDDIYGITLALASALFYGLVIICLRLLGRRNVPTRTVNFWRYSISTFLLLPLSVSGDLTFTFSQIPILFLFGFVFAVVACFLHVSGINRTRALHASIIGKSEPVIGSFYAWMFLQETPSLHTMLGGMLIIGSSLWLAWRGEQ